MIGTRGSPSLQFQSYSSIKGEGTLVNLYYIRLRVRATLVIKGKGPSSSEKIYHGMIGHHEGYFVLTLKQLQKLILNLFLKNYYLTFSFQSSVGDLYPNESFGPLTPILRYRRATPRGALSLNVKNLTKGKASFLSAFLFSNS